MTESLIDPSNPPSKPPSLPIKQANQLIPPLGFLLINLGFFGMLFLLAFHPLPETIKDIMFMLLGALTAAWKDVYGYYFGSSAGSQAKNETIATVVNGVKNGEKK